MRGILSERSRGLNGDTSDKKFVLKDTKKQGKGNKRERYFWEVGNVCW